MGIIGVGFAMWLAFVIAAPRVFTDVDIYLAFAETTPLFGIVALSLTFVVITGEIDLSFPSRDGAGNGDLLPRHLLTAARRGGSA